MVVQGVDPAGPRVQFVETGALANVALQMFDTLLEYDKNMNIVPSVAESYKLLDDQVTWQFKIRKGIKFWNGEVLDAKAVKFTFDRRWTRICGSKDLNDPFPAALALITPTSSTISPSTLSSRNRVCSSRSTSPSIPPRATITKRTRRR